MSKLCNHVHAANCNSSCFAHVTQKSEMDVLLQEKQIRHNEQLELLARMNAERSGGEDDGVRPSSAGSAASSGMGLAPTPSGSSSIAGGAHGASRGGGGASGFRSHSPMSTQQQQQQQQQLHSRHGQQNHGQQLHSPTMVSSPVGSATVGHFHPEGNRMAGPTSPTTSSSSSATAQQVKTLGPATAAALSKLEARIVQAEVSTNDLRKQHNSVSNSLQKFRDFQTLQGERIGLLEKVWEKVDALKVY